PRDREGPLRRPAAAGGGRRRPRPRLPRPSPPPAAARRERGPPRHRGASRGWRRPPGGPGGGRHRPHHGGERLRPRSARLPARYGQGPRARSRAAPGLVRRRGVAEDERPRGPLSRGALRPGASVILRRRILDVMPERWRAILVDDEALARVYLRELL